MQMRGDANVDIRLVTERDRGIGGIEFSAQRVPLDLVNASHGKAVAEFAAEWEELLKNSVQGDRDDSDTE